MRRLSAALLLTAALVIACASGAGAQGKFKIVFTGGSVYHSEPIPAGATVQFKVTCPAGYFATAGAVSSGNPKVLPLLSVKAGGGKSWSFGFRNTDANPITIVVVVTCNKPPAAVIGKLVLGGGKKMKKTVPAGASVKAVAPCPPGEAPVGDTEKSLTPGAK